MNTSKKVIDSLLDILGRDLQTLSAAELVLQLLAWAKLSKDAKIPATLRLTEDSLAISYQQLQDIFRQLSKLKSLGENSQAFESVLPQRSEVANTTIPLALRIVYDVAYSGILDHFAIIELPYQAFAKDFDFVSLPMEVRKLMLKLAGKVAKKRIYCPYDMPCLLASAVNQAGADVYVENISASPIPWLINILTDSDIHACSSDPVRQPSYHKAGQLEQFDMTISLVPIGSKYSPKVIEQDWFNRFPERTTSGSVLAIRHIIAQTKEKAVIAVPQGILFSRGAEHSLRQDLVGKGMIVGVINLPPALLPSTNIPLSILIIDKRKPAKTIRFVDGANDQFFERDGRNRSRLVNWEKVLEAFDHSADEAIALTVPVEEVIHNDAHLEVTRYLLPPEQKNAEQQLNNANTTMLKNIVDFVRPLPKFQGEGNLTALEVGVADFPEFGYLAAPQRSITVSETALTAKESATFLRPGDIVIATKGSVGKVAIVPDDVPQAGKDGWVVNQSCLILRSSGKIDTKALFMYLRSDVGQTLLKGIVSGATIPLIQLRALQDLQVIVPSREEAKSIGKDFDAQVELQGKIEQLRQQQQKLSKAHWGIEGVDG